MVSPRKIQQRKRRRLKLAIAMAVLVLGGLGLHGHSGGLSNLRAAGDSLLQKMTWISAGDKPAESVLRGTIYDRSLQEMAVSYQLFSLYVSPAEIKDKNAAAAFLAPLLDESQKEIAIQLANRQRMIELADNLNQEQAETINSKGIAGVFCKAQEVRFYPAHTVASHVLGFVGEGIGLAGIEGRYDAVLQPGAFLSEDVAGVDWQEQRILGRMATDVVLTLDMGLQKRIEKRFRRYLEQQGAAKGMGVLMEPFTGKVLALMNYPSFNPNYFWQADEYVRQNRMYRHNLRKELIQPLLSRTAAITREGLALEELLPPTVAAPGYGVDDSALAALEQQLCLYEPVIDRWGASSMEPPDGQVRKGLHSAKTLTGAQMGVALASLVNGGWRVAPYILDGVYDHATKKKYPRKESEAERRHVLAPATGIILRRELFRHEGTTSPAQKELISLQRRYVDVEVKDGVSQYVWQELYVGMTPVKMPRYLLLMAVEYDNLYPLPPGKKTEKLSAIGEDALQQATVQTPHMADAVPGQKSTENFHQFFISKRLNFREPATIPEGEQSLMPEIVGLSLRKGLQHITPHGLQVQFTGSGVIVAQDPAPGTSLANVDVCMLTLRSDI